MTAIPGSGVGGHCRRTRGAWCGRECFACNGGNPSHALRHPLPLSRPCPLSWYETLRLVLVSNSRMPAGPTNVTPRSRPLARPTTTTYFAPQLTLSPVRRSYPALLSIGLPTLGDQRSRRYVADPRPRSGLLCDHPYRRLAVASNDNIHLLVRRRKFDWSPTLKNPPVPPFASAYLPSHPIDNTHIFLLYLISLSWFPLTFRSSF